MKVLVTGGAGFIGSHVVRQLHQSGFQAVVVDNLSTGKQENVPDEIPLYNVDVTQPELHPVFAIEKPDYVIHLAAQANVQASLASPRFDAEQNVIGTLNVLQAAHHHSVKKLIFASSAAVYGDPLEIPITEQHPLQPNSFYGLSKATAEQYIQVYAKLYGLPYTVLRYANVYGSGQAVTGEAGVVAAFVHRLRQHQPPLIFGDGEQTRDFVYVKDVATANLLALHRGDGGTFNIGSGKQTKIQDLAVLLANLVNPELSALTQAARSAEIQHSCLNPTLARRNLNWRPRYDLPSGLADLIYAAEPAVSSD